MYAPKGTSGGRPGARPAPRSRHPDRAPEHRSDVRDGVDDRGDPAEFEVPDDISELEPDDPFELVPADAVVAVAMSGGVDSSVAAARCAARGLRTIGITLAMWPRDSDRDRDRGCCSIDAVEDARRVAGVIDHDWRSST